MATTRKNRLNNRILCTLIVCICSLSFGVSADHLRDKGDKELKKLLQKMNWKTNITTNAALIDQINDIYGKYSADYFISKHPFLKEKRSAKIDLKTLQWVNKELATNENSPLIFIYFPFDDLTEKAAQSLLFQVIAGAFKAPYKKPLMIFRSRKALVTFRSILKKNVLSLSDEIYKAHEDRFDILTPEQIAKIRKDITKYFENTNNSTHGFNFMKNSNAEEQKKVTINIIGHGNVAKESLNTTSSFDEEIVDFKDIVKDLISLGIPDNININLMSCHSAQDTDIKLTEAEYLVKFKNKSLTNGLLKDNKSFLNFFSKEIFTKSHAYNGNITGYFGEVVTYPHKKVYHLDEATNEIELFNYIYGVQFKLQDPEGGSIQFDKSQFKMTVNRSNH